ncbi:MAG: molybdenum cofactor biosynthesis protein MoaE, partial [Deltaproteobacteria bacterium]
MSPRGWRACAWRSTRSTSARTRRWPTTTKSRSFRRSAEAPVFEIVEQPIDLTEVAGAVASPEAGAIATFAGTTRATNRGRRVVRLEYEAYPEMAVREFEKIAAEAAERWEVCKTAIVHRVGPVAV